MEFRARRKSWSAEICDSLFENSDPRFKFIDRWSALQLCLQARDNLTIIVTSGHQEEVRRNDGTHECQYGHYEGCQHQSKAGTTYACRRDLLSTSLEIDKVCGEPPQHFIGCTFARRSASPFRPTLLHRLREAKQKKSHDRAFCLKEEVLPSHVDHGESEGAPESGVDMARVGHENYVRGNGGWRKPESSDIRGHIHCLRALNHCSLAWL